MTDVQNENELFKQRIEHDHQNAELRLEELRNIYKDNYDDYSYIWLLSTLNKVEKALSEAVDITNGWIPDNCDQTNIFDEQPESDPEPEEIKTERISYDDKIHYQELDFSVDPEVEEWKKEITKEEFDKEPEELPEVEEKMTLNTIGINTDNLQIKEAKPIKIHISDIFKKRG